MTMIDHSNLDSKHRICSQDTCCEDFVNPGASGFGFPFLNLFCLLLLPEGQRLGGSTTSRREVTTYSVSTVTMPAVCAACVARGSG